MHHPRILTTKQVEVFMNSFSSMRSFSSLRIQSFGTVNYFEVFQNTSSKLFLLLKLVPLLILFFIVANSKLCDFGVSLGA